MRIIRPHERLTLFQTEVEGYLTTAALLLLPGCNVVVDTMELPERMDPLWSHLRERGREKLPLWVINSHHHWDHVWGNSAFPGSPIIAHEFCRRRLETGGAAVLCQYRSKDDRYDAVSLVLPGLTFTDRMVLHDGDCRLELLHFPGHTDDSLLVTLPGEGLLLAGDSLEDPFPMLEWEGGTERYLRNLLTLRGKTIRTVIPGHGPLSGPDLIERNLYYVRQVWQMARLAVRRKEPLESLFEIPVEVFFRPAMDSPARRAGTSALNPPSTPASASPEGSGLRPCDRDTHARNLERAYLDARDAPEER
ncbi:MBL fold metallo-hydrolase [Heliobacterium gestii]|uniref:MBL fold metallo-hydrolase n=1 Tax=Heliomicrobium gestii TaxID=2699 RepID=A0A845LCP2_HELGE|nr:MBL fold metallo-hydrolase [Heliomicrobium gestii]MBM7867857.1 cyclase [Heliomicrobium gestii]MZP43331.1 MBL fold metallo-hydrolase [Heliomicrobium gestii]